MNRFVWLLLLVFVALPSAAQSSKSALGVRMVPWSTKVGDTRFESSRGFGKTLKHFHKTYRYKKTVKEHPVVNLPAVKYVFFENTNKDARWRGFNVYQIRGKAVRIFVIPR